MIRSLGQFAVVGIALGMLPLVAAACLIELRLEARRR